MDSSKATIGRSEGSNGQRNINTIIGFCMWTSLGLVAILLSRLDSIDAILDTRHDIALVVGYMWFVLMIVTFTVGIRFIRNMERFHTAEVVFWPSRCRHCVEALFGPQYARSSTGNTVMADDGETSNPDSDDFELNLITTSSIANVHENPRSRRNPHTDGNTSENLPDSGNPNSAICSSTRYSHGIHLSQQLNLKSHAINRAVLNVFMVFCFICCVGILDEAAYSIACYGARRNISGESCWKSHRWFDLLCSCLGDSSYLSLLFWCKVCKNIPKSVDGVIDDGPVHLGHNETFYRAL